MTPPGESPCRSSWMKRVRLSLPGTVIPARSPTGDSPRVHPDHHVACQCALYSVPSSLCPSEQKEEIGLGSKLVRIFYRGKLIKVHPRQPRGGRSTDVTDYPGELSAYTLRTPKGIKRRAERSHWTEVALESRRKSSQGCDCHSTRNTLNKPHWSMP